MSRNLIEYVKKARLFLSTVQTVTIISRRVHCESTSVRSDYGTCSQTTVQTQLTVCGGWKNAGQKEWETPTGRPAAFSVSLPLTYTTPLDKGHACNLKAIIRRRYNPPNSSRSPGRERKREWSDKEDRKMEEQEKLIRINGECSHIRLPYHNHRPTWKFFPSREYTFYFFINFAITISGFCCENGTD